jgi:hypothetical protein
MVLPVVLVQLTMIFYFDFYHAIVIKTIENTLYEDRDMDCY